MHLGYDTCNFEALDQGKNYWITARAYNNGEWGDFATISPATPHDTPSPPPLTSAGSGNGYVTLRTQSLGARGADLTPFDISLYPTFDATTPIASCRVPVAQQTCTLTGLVNGTTYFAEATATNRKGASVPTERLVANPRTTVPGPARNIQATQLAPGVKVADVTWDAPVDGGGLPITKYAVRSYNKQTLYFVDTCETSAMTCRIELPGSSIYGYSIYVYAHNDLGTQPWAPSVTIIPN